MTESQHLNKVHCLLKYIKTFQWAICRLLESKSPMNMLTMLHLSLESTSGLKLDSNFTSKIT